MKILIFLILFLPLVYASSIAVSPLEVNLDQRNDFTIFNPNENELNFQLKSEKLEFDITNGTIQPNNKQRIKIKNNNDDLVIIETSANMINPGIAIKVYKKSTVNSMITSKWLYIFIAIVIIILVWILWRI